MEEITKYKGVCWNKRNKKWAAAIRCNNKTYHLGYFTDEIEAAKAGVYPPLAE